MRSHGEYEFQIVGNIIKIKVMGSFNSEGAADFYADLKENIKETKGRPYYIVEDANEFEGATPDAYEKANAVNKWINTHYPPVSRIYIMPDSVKITISLNKEKELSKQNLKFFHSEKEAFSWIRNNEKSRKS